MADDDFFKSIGKGLVVYLSDGHVGEAYVEPLTPPCFLVLHKEGHLLGPIQHALKL